MKIAAPTVSSCTTKSMVKKSVNAMAASGSTFHVLDLAAVFAPAVEGRSRRSIQPPGTDVSAA